MCVTALVPRIPGERSAGVPRFMGEGGIEVAQSFVFRVAAIDQSCKVRDRDSASTSEHMHFVYVMHYCSRH